MLHTKSFRSAALVLGVLFAAACSEQPSTGPKSLRSLSPNSNVPALNVVGTKPATVTVCAEGPIGTYGYSIVVTSTSKNTISKPLGDNFTLSEGQCADAVVMTQGGGFVWGETDPPSQVLVTQTSAPANTKLDYLQKTEEANQAACTPGDTFPCGLDTQESGPSTTVDFNFYHGSVVSYWNEEVVHDVTGCTLTLGYWKNHTSNWPSPYSPNDAFFNSGKSWIQILNTPPKGSAYLILAHQYIAAALNVAAGASMPADVQTAFDNATNYFQNGGSGDLTGWATILDNYNNGLAAGGPAHCD